jgi:hypothetical protein
VSGGARRRVAWRRLWSGVAIVALGCSGAGPLPLPEAEPAPSPRIVRSSEEVGPPSGVLTVGVPADPTGWIVPEGDDLAALDLAALWGLPLYRFDPSGQPVRAFAADERVSEDGRRVEVDLAEGEWSDGTPVTAEDVVATVAALRGTELGRDLEVVDEVVAVSPRTVRFDLSQPTVRWQMLLGPTGVLPAHVLADGGLAAAATLDVTGGGFRLSGREEGLGASFAAHPASPLGSPALEELRVLLVPSYDVALGLLDEGRLDLAVGYLAVGAVRRAAALDLEAAAPVGGTWIGLHWSPEVAVGRPERRGVAAVLDVSEQVEGLGLGEELYLPILTAAAPEVAPPPTRQDDIPAVGELTTTLVVRADEEALLLTGRLVEAQLRASGGDVTLRRERTPADVGVAREADVALRVRRDGPRPDLTPWLAEEASELARAADAAPSVFDGDVLRALEAGLDEARVVPLYRPPVAHVWRAGVEGVVPSAWPGAGFAGAMRWSVAGAS